MFWGMLVVVIILGIIKMFIEFPGLLELKLIYGVEVVEVTRDTKLVLGDVDTDSVREGGSIIENINVLENSLKTDIDEENNCLWISLKIVMLLNILWRLVNIVMKKMTINL